jgi:hypothetical protein
MFANIAKVTVPTTGTGSPLTIGAAVPGFNGIPAALDGKRVSYALHEGTNRETAWGVYNSSAGTLTRNTIDSTNGGAPISLGGNAQLFVTPLDRDLAPLAYFRPPPSSVFSFTANGSSSGSSASDNLGLGFGFKATDPGASGAERIRFIGKTIPAGTGWTAVARITPTASMNAGLAVRVGLGVIDATSKNGFHVCLSNEADSGIFADAFEFTDLDSTSSHPMRTPLYFSGFPEWLMIYYDGGYYRSRFSRDGVLWSDAWAYQASLHPAPTHIGLTVATFDALWGDFGGLCSYYSDPDLP